jgi:hypothetical protein
MSRRTRTRHEFLQPGNNHVGWTIHTFSIPAFSTCPGATPACLTACYAMRFLFRSATTLRAHQRNWERALDAPEDFAREVVEEIRYKRVRSLRVHVAGDFFAAAYVRAWTKVARACPGVSFLFYTRSWRVPELVPHLLELASLPNVFAWWSEDRDTGPALFPVGRRCFLCTEPDDEALVPPGVDLVFRDDTRAPTKWVRGAWVCPKEQGTGADVTCSHCLRCLLPGPMPVPPGQRGHRRDGSA